MVLRLVTLFSAIAFSGFSCRNSNLQGPAVPGHGINQNKDTTEQSELPQGETPYQGSESSMEEALPPANISGAYLVCAESKPATASLPEVSVNCALKDEISNTKINLISTYTGSRWTYKAPTNSTLTLTVKELPNNPNWHVAFTVKGTTVVDVQTQLESIAFSLEVQDAGGVSQQESTTISQPSVYWLSLDGAQIPSQAVPGGTENEGARTLYLCRVYYGNEVIPGRLVVHHNDPNKSICYAASNGVSIISHTDDGLSVIHRSDVLVIREGAFADYFEWLPASNGQLHAHAYVAGYDATGQPLYSCRGTQADGVVVEQTPGSLKQGSQGCVFNFNGSQTRTDYEVLSWKQTAS